LARVKSYNKQAIAADPAAVPSLLQMLANDQGTQGGTMSLYRRAFPNVVLFAAFG
jgi:hypothetical protein